VGYARRLDVERFAVLGIGSSIDVSMGGARLLVHETVPLRSRLELNLVLDGREACIDTARVVRAEAVHEGAHEIAVQFEQLSRRAAAAIAAFVDARLLEKRSVA